jgi:hypothetical protein
MSKSLRMPIARLTEDQMREIVLDRLACKVMFSQEIPIATRSMCLLPVAMGAFAVPAEIREAVLGSAEPPDSLPGEPDKPVHPGYPDPVGDPPVKPVLAKVPDRVASDYDYGDITEDEYAEIRAEIKAANDASIREWHDDSMAWHEALDEETRTRREVDEAHNVTVEAWEANLPQHAEAVEAREAAIKDWTARHDEAFAEWGHDIGEIMGRIKDSFPRGVNGYPMFYAVQAIHKDDWSRIEAAILREQGRQVQV